MIKQSFPVATLPFFTAALLISGGGCALSSAGNSLRAAVGGGAAIEWTRSAIVVPGGRGLTQPEGRRRGVSEGTFYVSVRAGGFVLRDLPGIAPDAPVAVGLEVRGLAPDGAPIQMVLDVFQPTNGVIVGRDLPPMPPMLLTRSELVVSLFAVSMSSNEEADHLRGKIAGAGRINLMNREHRALARTIFVSTFQPFRTGASRVWRFSRSLHAVNSKHRNQPERLLLRGRTVYLLQPPTTAPASLLARTDPRRVGPRVTLEGEHLVWKDSGQTYTETPYVVLAVDGRTRRPHLPERIVGFKSSFARMVAKRKYFEAGGVLRAWKEALRDSRVLGTNDRLLELAIHRARVRQLKADMALTAHRNVEATGHLRAQRRELALVLKQFAPILFPSEKRSLKSEVASLRRAEEEVQPSKN